ncbi:unnamed protein product [Paramecium octaurelia]|uniref:Uncharacterized protein n=1 Tax=Paramecium octaurelia TaxID=43137 RepID=A0A8S1Y0L5_PAROT|nr:unnamed protein product [Paramecium octaurelia]
MQYLVFFEVTQYLCHLEYLYQLQKQFRDLKSILNMKFIWIREA